MVAIRYLETYDYAEQHPTFMEPPQTTTTTNTGIVLSLPFRPLPAGMYDQELSEEAAEQMEQVLEHRSGRPTRPASDLPDGDLSMLRRRGPERR